ncbi:hypothetical protein R4Y45_07345 [Holzapfeliella sp. He02]|uniref:Uncharacterized protein n=1 Tax=Holzapfeliella saturejae TaxID=3082953 RepID=A0ABU8SIH5_9LACO
MKNKKRITKLLVFSTVSIGIMQFGTNQVHAEITDNKGNFVINLKGGRGGGHTGGRSTGGQSKSSPSKSTTKSGSSNTKKGSSSNTTTKKSNSSTTKKDESNATTKKSKSNITEKSSSNSTTNSSAQNSIKDNSSSIESKFNNNSNKNSSKTATNKNNSSRTSNSGYSSVLYSKSNQQQQNNNSSSNKFMSYLPWIALGYSMWNNHKLTSQNQYQTGYQQALYNNPSLQPNLNNNGFGNNHGASLDDNFDSGSMAPVNSGYRGATTNYSETEKTSFNIFPYIIGGSLLGIGAYVIFKFYKKGVKSNN